MPMAESSFPKSLAAASNVTANQKAVYAAATFTNATGKSAQMLHDDSGLRRGMFSAGEPLCLPRQQTREFLFDHFVTLARHLFQLWTVKNANATSGIADHARSLQFASGLGDAFRAWV